MKLILQGLGASAGIVEGVAKIFIPGQPSVQFPENAILVTTLTDPTMVMAMTKASAIITDMGGITSHPAILSREMGIPCVVNTKRATQVIQDGMNLKINGTTGEIFLLT